jgi:minor extracellular serine protease Vpr
VSGKPEPLEAAVFRVITLVIFLCHASGALALDLVRIETSADMAYAAYGVSGQGTTIAILDTGITWDHPDFINEDGTTRIRWMLDMTGQSGCSADNPDPVEYAQSEVNQALANGGGLAMRDALGRGTSAAGAAAGNGRSLPDRRYRGIAPEADLVIVKLMSEGVPAHGGIAAEAAFQGCADDAIEWVSDKMDQLGQPGVLIINGGKQWGPMDGSSAISRKLATVFPDDLAGRVVVLPAGDEGSLPNHARAGFDATEATRITFNRTNDATHYVTGWYDGEVPADITVELAGGIRAGPVGPGQSVTENSITITQYPPGTEFYPWTSTSGDRAVWIRILGPFGGGSIQIKARDASNGKGSIDLYGDVESRNLTPFLSFLSHLAPGRLQDLATTPTALVAGSHTIRTQWMDIDGISRSITTEGSADDLWLNSSAGPTRDRRDHGVDVTAPGQNAFAPIGKDSLWATLRRNLPQGSDGDYGRFTGTSAAASITAGAVALMLQMNPTMTTRQARKILRETARSDEFTGNVPDKAWGFGKLDVHAAVSRSLAYSFSGPWFNPAESGHGWFVEMLEGPGDEQRLNVYWYVYTDGKPAWILATGVLDGQTATLDAWITRDGQFPPAVGAVNVIPWGTMRFQFGTDGAGTASWTTSYAGFSSGSLPIVQLARIAGGPDACYSGSFYNPQQNGHGFVVEVIDIGGVSYALVAWYVYLNGEQVWLLGQAPISNGRSELPMESFSGAGFPPAFKPSDVVRADWGTLIIDFSGPDTASVQWQSNQPGFGNGGLDVIRLTGLGGHDCLE